MQAWLSALVPPNRICPFLDLSSIRAKLQQNPDAYRLYAGHFGLDLLSVLPNRPRLITWLRDPTRRLLSSYHYLRELSAPTSANILTGAYARAQREAAIKLSFDQWVRLPQDKYALHNIQVQFLAGANCSEEQMLPHAIRTLVEADHFGLTERMQDSLDLLCHRFVLLPRPLSVKLNASRAGQQTNLPPDTLEIIRQRSDPAIQLCRVANEIFDQRWHNMLVGLELAPPPSAPPRRSLPMILSSFFRKPPPPSSPSATGGNGSATSSTLRGLIHARLESRFRTLRAKNSPARYGRFPITDAIYGDGWMAPVSSPGGRAIRWSGPDPHSVFYLNLIKDVPLQISLTMLAVMDYEIIESFRLQVNGRRVPLVVEPAPEAEFPYAHRFTGVITPSDLSREPGLVKLEFFVARTFQEPVASEPELGPKSLGFAIDAIQARPV